MRQFSCSKDKSVEFFLHEKAIEFEKIHKSRTFLIVDDEEFEKGIINILGYFSLALKVLTMPDETSNRKLTLLDGLSAKIKGKRILNYPVFLIGQLAKNDNFKSQIQGKEIIELAVDVIKEAQKNVGGRIILIECNDHERLKSFYLASGFDIINKDDDGLLQMITLL